MGLAIYQIQMYQKTTPITKHAKITQEIWKLDHATEKDQKSLKKVKGMLLKLTNYSYWPSFSVEIERSLILYISNATPKTPKYHLTI